MFFIFLGAEQDAAQTLNADALYIGGTPNLNILPLGVASDAQVSLLGCIEAPRFVTYSIAIEPPPQLNFYTQMEQDR